MSASMSCQSCGMPMSRDERGGGTNTDGSKSLTYCSHCYTAGKFTLPDLTVDQMKERVRGKMQEMGFPRVLSWVFTRKIPRLQRWAGGDR